MDSQAQSSFIPKKPLSGSPVRSGSAALGMFFILIGMLFFVASVIAAGGAFIYQGYLKSSIAQKSDTLQKAEDAFDPETIADLLRLDSRINNTQTLLQNHITAMAVFSFLSEQTLVKVQFTGFTFQLQEKGAPQISLIGVADSFSTVALQSDRFSTSKVLKNVVFSGITVNETGGINFSVKADLDPSLVNYAKNLNASPTGSLPQSASVASTTVAAPAAPIQNNPTTLP